MRWSKKESVVEALKKISAYSHEPVIKVIKVDKNSYHVRVYEKYVSNDVDLNGQYCDTLYYVAKYLKAVNEFDVNELICTGIIGTEYMKPYLLLA